MRCRRHFFTAKLSEEEWKYYLFHDSEALNSFLKKEPVFDIVCVDLTVLAEINVVEKIRKMNRNAYIILVATADISPMIYMKPAILAGSLLLRKFTAVQMKQVFEEAFRTYLEKFESDEDKESVYVIDTREGRQLIPYSSIYYFEAREKKIIVGTAETEIICYDTISRLEQELPSFFVRCHRSFVINSKKIVKLISVQNTVVMEHDICIPLSRSCKAAVKEAFMVSKDTGGGYADRTL